RSGHPDLAAADRRPSGVRRGGRRPRRRAAGRLEADRGLFEPTQDAAPRPLIDPGRPWWLDEAPPVEPQPPLEGELEVDVAIVGGGYTGLWTALAVRELGPSTRVAVLEAELCGEGPSGRNGGFLHDYWSSLSRLRGAFGDRGATTVAQASAAVVSGVREVA